MESAEAQPDSPVPTASVAKPGCWKRCPDLVGRAGTAGPAGAAPVTTGAMVALPPSPFSLVAPPSTAACDRLGMRSSLMDIKTIDSRHSGGGAATDSGSSDATQLIAVHAAQSMGLSPESPSRGSLHGAAASQAVIAGSCQWGMSAMPDGLSGLVESRKPGRRTVDPVLRTRPQLVDSAISQAAQGTALSQRSSAGDPTMAVAVTATAALNLAADRLRIAGGHRQLTALPQGSAGLAAAAAAAAHLVLQGASPSEAANKILAMVLPSRNTCCTSSSTSIHGCISAEQPSFC